MTIFSKLLRKPGSGVVLLQWVGNLAFLLLAFAWLQIPDSHAWQFVFSLLTGAVLVIGFLWLHAHTFRKLRLVVDAGPLWTRLLLLLIVFVIGYFALGLIDKGRSYEGLFAGYWNSKLSPSMRATFTYEFLVRWQDRAYDLLQWLLAAILLPIAFVGGGAGFRGNAWRGFGRVYCKVLYWVTVVVAGFLGLWIWRGLVDWMPGHGVAGETLSVLVRVGLAYTVVILLWCFVLAVIASYLEPVEVSEAVEAA